MKKILMLTCICISIVIITVVLIISSTPTDETKIKEKVWNLIPQETKSMLLDKMEDGRVSKVKIDESYQYRALNAYKRFPYDKYKRKTLYLVIYDKNFSIRPIDDKGNNITLPLLIFYGPYAKKIAAIKWGYFGID